jgi:hypothetical protein
MSINKKIASTPPMGWNSWISYACYVVEDEVKAHADYMAAHLLKFGYDTIVIDAGWYSPLPPENYTCVDENGRLIPEIKKFPSSARGKGFKPLADYCHRKGLKFGLHLMRGVPIAAVKQNLPILGAKATCDDIADLARPTGWDTGCRSIDMSKPGAQAYYTSIFKQFADWGVDFVKYDDMIQTRRYGHCRIPAPHAAEVEGISQGIAASGCNIILSISPGEADPSQADFMRQHVQMQRISGDFWDSWAELKFQFELCAAWAPQIGNGYWPDADMLPLGKIALRFDLACGRGPDRDTRFTFEEQVTMMTLWCIFRSPLMLGNDLKRMDPMSLAMITNPEVLAVNQSSTENRELFRRGEHVAWSARDPKTGGWLLAVFNISDAGPTKIPVELSLLGIDGACAVRDLWARQDLDPARDVFTTTLPAHAAGLYRLSPSK